MAFSTLIIGVAFLPLFTMTGVVGRDLLADGAHLRVRHRRRDLHGADADAGADHLMLRPTTEEKESLVDALACTGSTSRSSTSRCEHRKRASALALVPIVALHRALPVVRWRVHAEARRRQLLDPRDAADVDLAEQSASYVGRMRDDPCMEHPEGAVTVVSQLGRPDDGTDVAGFYNIELFAPLKPFDEWPHGLTKEKLTDELARRVRRSVPGRRLQLLAVHLRQRRGGAFAA